MKKIEIYEYTSSTTLTIIIDKDVYNGGSPITTYNIYNDSSLLNSYSASSVTDNIYLIINDLNIGS